MLVVAAVASLACRDRGGGPAPASVDPWVVRDEATLAADIRAATRRAQQEDKLVLLEFVANWCADCREVVRVSGDPSVQEILRRRYVVVPVNVGAWDRHRALLAAHHVSRIAALVVLDAQGRAVARTTLEPITRHQPLTAAMLVRWLREPRGT